MFPFFKKQLKGIWGESPETAQSSSIHCECCIFHLFHSRKFDCLIRAWQCCVCVTAPPLISRLARRQLSFSSCISVFMNWSFSLELKHFQLKRMSLTVSLLPRVHCPCVCIDFICIRAISEICFALSLMTLQALNEKHIYREWKHIQIRWTQRDLVSMQCFFCLMLVSSHFEPLSDGGGAWDYASPSIIKTTISN